jgi:Tol biopolymer transport system component
MRKIKPVTSRRNSERSALHLIAKVFFLLALTDAWAIDQPRIAKSVTLLRDNAGRPAWSTDGNYIAFHARGADGYYDVYVMKADGTDEICLTCNNSQLPNKHTGQPSWHPSGEWIAFQAEKAKHVLSNVGALAAPGIGFHNDVYVMSRDTKKVYRLTDLDTKRSILDPTPTSAILQPHFSADGSLLSWAERVGNAGKWGEWVIRVADFKVDAGVPQIGNIRMFAPGVTRQYMESNDFTSDGKLLICGNLEAGQTEVGLDIYILDLENGETERLTHTMNEFDECPHPSPDGKQIAFLSTRGFPTGKGGWWSWARGEFWLMDARGKNQRRLTYFNEPGYPEYTGKRVIPAYIFWNPDGKSLLVGVAVETKRGVLKDQIYLVELY